MCSIQMCFEMIDRFMAEIWLLTHMAKTVPTGGLVARANAQYFPSMPYPPQVIIVEPVHEPGHR